MTIFELAALLLTLSAVFGWINRRFLRLPHSVGLLVLGLAASLFLVGADLAFPGVRLYGQLERTLRQIDFTRVVIDGMLAFLLFAGALNLDLERLRSRALPIAYLAVLGTVLSTALIGLAFWAVGELAGAPIPLPWAFVFGALISPTDPIAVVAMLRDVKLPENLKVESQGESLFNDGVAIVVLTAMLTVASDSEVPSLGAIAWDFLKEAGGGAALGLAAGYLAYRAIRTIDDYPVEVLITLALVTASFAIAQRLGMSGPIATVTAGLLVGYRGPKDAMSNRTQRYVSALWTLIDEVLNSVLFLLIGLEVLVLRPITDSWPLVICAIPIALLARGVAVSAPLLLPLGDKLDPRYAAFLTWAGVRGGISVALALALPETDSKSVILAATYAVVLFTLLVQGLTLKNAVAWLKIGKS